MYTLRRRFVPDDPQMSDAASLFDGNQILTSIFGEWPSFHDAEVIDVQLWRGDVKPGEWDDSNVFPVLTVKVRILEATQPGATGDSGRDVLATLRFHDVDDVKIEGFNHQNAILGISIVQRERGKFASGEDLPPDLVVIFEPAFGVAASFRCRRAEILAALRASDSR
jgi:hypothetical protein